MRIAPRHHGSHVQDVDITAMIDVVFLLIIFFMTTAQFARMTRARVDLPAEPGEEREAGPESTIIVNITSDGAIVIDQQAVSLDRLARMVAAEVARAGGDATAVELTIRADRALSAGVLNDIARTLTGAGLRGVRLATTPPRAAGGGGS